MPMTIFWKKMPDKYLTISHRGSLLKNQHCHKNLELCQEFRNSTKQLQGRDKKKLHLKNIHLIGWAEPKRLNLDYRAIVKLTNLLLQVTNNKWIFVFTEEHNDPKVCNQWCQLKLSQLKLLLCMEKQTFKQKDLILKWEVQEVKDLNLWPGISILWSVKILQLDTEYL